MNIPLRIIFAAMLVFVFSSAGFAGEKAKLGPCVKACVHAYNPSLADSGADEFMVDDFRAKECVQMCKENTYEGECNSWADDCCNADFLDTDPDCQSEPPVDPPDPPNPPGDGLPPDPGEAGKATLEGIDSDQDGIRDDIQRYIALTYPDSQKTRAALRQFTLAFQKATMESPDEESALKNVEIMHRASECLWHIHSENSIKIKNALKAEWLNTMERSRAYLAYNSKLGGHTFGGKDFDEYKTSCTFDSDIMED
jgi:hypothetical protein